MHRPPLQTLGALTALMLAVLPAFAANTPLCNAWLAMLRGVGVKAERHGDSSGELTQMVA